jgi:hypothetical protein
MPHRTHNGYARETDTEYGDLHVFANATEQASIRADGLPAGLLVVDANVGIGGGLAAGRDDADAHKFEPLPFEFGYGEGEHDDRVDLAPRGEPVEEVTPIFGVADPWAEASAAEDLGIFHARGSDRDQAVHHLTLAIHGYHLTGAAADMARVRRRLRELGVQRRHWAQWADRPVVGWQSLTDTEHAASELVA